MFLRNHKLNVTENEVVITSAFPNLLLQCFLSC